MPSSARRTSITPGKLLVEGDAPVPAVAAEIHEPAAAIDPRFIASHMRVEWYSGWVPVMMTR